MMSLLRTDPVTPVAIWTVLMLLAALALVLLFDPQAMRRPLSGLAGVLSRSRQAALRRQEEAAEVVRYADELRAACDRAGDGAQRWHEVWQDAEQDAQAAWQDWQESGERVERLRAASAFAHATFVATPAEYAARERYLHRALHAAVSRGDLPGTAPADLAAGRGWDPRLHPVEQELALQRAVTAHKWQVFGQASAAERAAWHDSRLAGTALDSLREEAADAELRAAVFRGWLPGQETRAAVSRGRVLAPRPA